MTTKDVVDLIPVLHRQHVGWLRSEQAEHFGWERLLLCAERLQIPVDVTVGEAA